MKRIIIIGAGGMGREFYNIIRDCIVNETNYCIAGFIDDNVRSLDGFIGYPPLLSTISEYIPRPDDVFVCSMGDVPTRKSCIEKILSKGGKFETFVHPLAVVHSNAKIGIGTIIDKFAVIGADSTVGDYCLVQIGSVVGHDVTIGNFTRIDCHVLCVGGTTIGNNVCIHTNAMINHGVTVEDDSTIGAMSFVIRKVKQGSTVQGNPAKLLQ